MDSVRNSVKTKRKAVKRDSKRYSFSFEKSLINAFIQKAGECGYNTTEALEVLMQKAIDGLLPRKATTTWVGNESPYGITEVRFNVGKPFTSLAEINETLKKQQKTYVDSKPSYIKELTPEEKEFNQLDQYSKFLMNEMQRKTHNATALLRDYITKENQLENVVEGPIVQEMFGSLKVCVKLNTSEVIAVDIETQELTIYSDGMKVGETNE